MNVVPAWWKLLQLPVAVTVGGYVLLAITAPFLAERALYHPGMASRRAPSGMITLRDPAGRAVAALHLPNPGARFTLWFFHGNAEDLGDLEPLLETLQAAGFAVFASEYPGYGFSEGAPSEEAIYRAARVARDYLRRELGVPAARTILMGRSLGGGPAVQLATEERVGGLVLQSAFTSVYRVVTRWPLLPFDQFANERKLARISAPVLVMHGAADEVIPFWHGERLLAAAPGVKRSLWIPGARHNDFGEVAGPRLLEALREFAALCEQAGPRSDSGAVP